IIRNQIQKFLWKKQKELGFQEVISPILGTEHLYKISGHLEHYHDYMFPVISRNNEAFRLRPMTCPHHCLIYHQRPRSYRDLPLRLCENAILYRYETSGSLKGLERLREAAFYGPKLDVEVKAADGKNITLATMQLDFVLPQKFGLNYIDKEQKLKTPVIIHQTPLAPVQLVILPINNQKEVQKYSENLQNKLLSNNFRSEIWTEKTLNYRINQVHRKKAPYYLVIGEKELKNKKVKLATEELTEEELLEKLHNQKGKTDNELEKVLKPGAVKTSFVKLAYPLLSPGITVAYDGSNFWGWAKQPNKFTVQGYIENVIGRIFHLEVSILASSRTDKGVHAREQKFTLWLPFFLPEKSLLNILRRQFQECIAIKK
ncbi:25127_t:CDS:2, partial [Racocetra persica]